MDRALVDQVRRFNRSVTQRVGALDDAYLSRERSLGQSRLLWEIGADGCDVRTLRSRLDLDAAYVSRLLRSLEAAGLVVVEPSRDDRRVRRARLTAAGRSERDLLDRRSDELAESILDPLSAGQRIRLTEAMDQVDRLLTASSIDVRPRDPRDPQARACIAAYYDELARRFDAGFDPTRSISATDAELTPPAGVLLVATLHGEPVACGALKLHAGARAAAVAEVKRMWVSPVVRGLGVGRRVLHELEQQARALGVTLLRLETNRSLTEAVALYRSAGYREVRAFNSEPYADHWFQKRL